MPKLITLTGLILKKLLRAALQNNFFNFEGKIYKQIDGVAMGSPLGATLANAFLCFHEQVWLKKCPDQFKPVYYKRYADDIFVLFRSPDHLEKFKNYLTQGPAPDPKCKLIISSFLTLPHLLDGLNFTRNAMSIVLSLQILGGWNRWGVVDLHWGVGGGTGVGTIL